MAPDLEQSVQLQTTSHSGRSVSVKPQLPQWQTPVIGSSTLTPHRRAMDGQCALPDDAPDLPAGKVDPGNVHSPFNTFATTASANRRCARRLAQATCGVTIRFGTSVCSSG